jgi:hypothetical protein
MNWIDVNIRLPKKTKSDVLARLIDWRTGRYYYDAALYDNGFVFTEQYDTLDKITHWCYIEPVKVK